MHNCSGRPRMASRAAHLWALGTVEHTPAPHGRSQPRSHTAGNDSVIQCMYDLSRCTLQAHARAYAQRHAHLPYVGAPSPAVPLDDKSLIALVMPCQCKPLPRLHIRMQVGMPKRLLRRQHACLV